MSDESTSIDEDEIVELAIKIEARIEEGERLLEDLPDFERGREIREASTVVRTEEVLGV
jgi:hypothetical protein